MFVRSTKFKGAFEGKPVAAELTPLTLESLLSIQSAATQEEAVSRIAEVLPKNVTLTTPPVDADGLPVSIEDICSHAYFASLIGDLGKALIDAAKPANPVTPAAASDGSRRANDSAQTSSATSAE